MELEKCKTIQELHTRLLALIYEDGRIIEGSAQALQRAAVIGAELMRDEVLKAKVTYTYGDTENTRKVIVTAIRSLSPSDVVKGGM